jgi:hypothetical protein
MQKLSSAGVPESVFFSLSHQSGENSRLEIALIAASLAHLHKQNYQFVPIALGWGLGPEKAVSHSLTFHPHYSTQMPPGPRSQHLLTQLQPALDSTQVSVLQPTSAALGTEQLRRVFRHRFEPDSKAGEIHLRQARIGLGIAHAADVADKFMINPTYEAQCTTPLYGPQSVGRSLFILLDYLVFKNFQDLVGEQVFGWLELRIISPEGGANQPRLLTTVHTDLRAIIPVGSLIAIANLPWFKE